MLHKQTYIIDTSQYDDILNPKISRRNETHEKMAIAKSLQNGSLSMVCNKSDSTSNTEGLFGVQSKLARMLAISGGDNVFLEEMCLPPIGPPLSETGCSGGRMNYMGMPMIAPLTLYVHAYDPHWCMRKVRLSLGKLLRRDFSSFCCDEKVGKELLFGFRKCLRFMQQYDHPIHSDIQQLWRRKELWLKAGLPYCVAHDIWDLSIDSYASACDRYSVVMLLFSRVISATLWMKKAIPRTMPVFHLQLWMDTLLDLAEFVIMGGRNGKTPVVDMTDLYLRDSGAMLLLYPHGRRFVQAGDLPDVSGICWAVNFWRDTPTAEKTTLDRFLTIFFNKLGHHKCLIRKFDEMIEKYCKHDPQMRSLIHDVIHVIVMGNYPQAGRRSPFGARIHIRRYMLKFFRVSDRAFERWIDVNKITLYYIMREYNHYMIQKQPALEHELHRTQNRRSHIIKLAKACDDMRDMFGECLVASYGGPKLSMPLFKLMDLTLCKIQANVFCPHHKDQQQTYVKLKKGRFDVMLHKQLKKHWHGFRLSSSCSSVPILQASAKSSYWIESLSKKYQQFVCDREQNSTENEPASSFSEMIHGKQLCLDNVIDVDVYHPADRYMNQWIQQVTDRDLYMLTDVYPDILGPRTMEYIDLIVKHEKQGVGAVFQIWWPRVLGMSWRGYMLLLYMNYSYQRMIMSDDKMASMLCRLYEWNARDYFLLMAYCSAVFSRSNTSSRLNLPRIYLGDQVAIHQIEACRLREGNLSWQETDLSKVGVKYYCECGQWKEAVVLNGHSEHKDIYAIGLTKSAYDNLTKTVVCTRYLVGRCSPSLRTVNMIGHAVKLGSQWYVLCAKCGILTKWCIQTYSEIGPDCGCHNSNMRDRVVESNAFRAMSRDTMLMLHRYSVYGLLYGTADPDIGIKCCYCQKPLDVMSRQYKLMWVIVTWKSTWYLPRAYRDSDHHPSSEVAENEEIEQDDHDSDIRNVTFEALSTINESSRLEFTPGELMTMNHLKSRYRMPLYSDESTQRILKKDYSYFLTNSNANRSPGLKLVPLCRTDYTYATSGRPFDGIPFLEDVWKTIRYFYNRRYREQILQRYRRTKIPGLTSLLSNDPTVPKRQKRTRSHARGLSSSSTSSSPHPPAPVHTGSRARIAMKLKKKRPR